MAGLGGPGSGCPWALQALLASSPAGSLSPRSPPSSRGSLLSLFKDPPVLEETFGSASVGSFVSVVRAPACPRWRRQPSECGPPLPTRLQPHHPVQDPGQLPEPRPSRGQEGKRCCFFGRLLFLKLSCGISQGNAFLNTAGRQSLPSPRLPLRLCFQNLPLGAQHPQLWWDSGAKAHLAKISPASSNLWRGQRVAGSATSSRDPGYPGPAQVGFFGVRPGASHLYQSPLRQELELGVGVGPGLGCSE